MIMCYQCVLHKFSDFAILPIPVIFIANVDIQGYFHIIIL